MWGLDIPSGRGTCILDVGEPAKLSIGGTAAQCAHSAHATVVTPIALLESDFAEICGFYGLILRFQKEISRIGT